ncbi:MAG: cytoplasmic protein [Actinobacteria bacterium]|nr:cytoplasmic protein [Actinomycetota bacterium]
MTTPIRILLVGESWTSTSTHFKGWNQFTSTMYQEGHAAFRDALGTDEFTLTHLPAHAAASEFPATLDELNVYDVLVLSDIGADTLLLHPDTWLHGLPTVNRLKLIRDWVEAGGGFAMCGGYLSFSGIGGTARYGGTPIEEILPVTISRYDDRVETPDGVTPEVVEEDHVILEGVSDPWPIVLGYNRLEAKEGITPLVTANQDPFLITGTAGNGRTLAWATDIGPHWCPQPFIDWPGYARVLRGSMKWLAKRG